MRVRQQFVALVAATMVLFVAVVGVFANAPDPGSIGGSSSGLTATVSGDWAWPAIDKCDGREVGWAIDWHDPAAPGNTVNANFAVGTSSDNTVHSNGDCGHVTTGKDRGGSWGPISHTYANAGTYNVCAVMYDVHLDAKTGNPQAAELVAGGGGHNKDNSVEANHEAPTGPGCTTVTLAAPANIAVRHSVNKQNADPGDTLTFTIALTNSGGSTGSVDVKDNIAPLLARGSFVSATGGGILSGSNVVWNNVSVGAGASTNLALSVRLNTNGWPQGATMFTSTVVAANTNCDTGSDATCSATTTVSPNANLVASLGVDRTNADPGDTLNYTITVRNTGGADATGVSVSDPIAALLAHGSLTSASGDGALNGSTVAWTGLAIDAGATATLTFGVRLSSSGWGSGATTLTNQVVVPNTNCASGSSDGSCRTSTTVSVSPNLVVRKSVDKTSANPGDSLTYTITVQNTGSGDASGVTVSDAIGSLLAHGSFVSATGGGGLNGSTVAWSAFTLNAGDSKTVTITIRLDASGWGSGTTSLPNTVIVPGSNCAAGSSDGNCKVSTTVTVSPNLVVRKTVDKTLAGPGDTLTYTISVQNTGSGDASGVAISDALGPVLAHGSFVSASGGGSLSGSTVSWSSFALAAGDSKSVTVTVKLDTTGWSQGATTLPNAVVVGNSNCAAGSSDGTCKASTVVNANSSLTVHKSVNQSTADPGDSLTYTITVQNTGNATASNVDVTDDIATILAHASFTGASAGGTLAGTSVHWDNLSVAPDATSTLTFTVKLDTTGWPQGTTTLANTVVVAGSDCGTGASNGNCRASTTVATHAALAVRKTVSTTSADPGDTITYTISVQNTGNVAATNVDVTDDISTILAHASYTGATGGGSLVGSTVHWDNKTFNAGGSTSFNFTVKLDASGWPVGTTNLSNTIVVPGSDCAAGASNGNCRVSTSVTPHFTVTITKGASAGSSGPWSGTLAATDGDTVWYQIKVTNTGNATVSGLTVTDSLGIPAGQCTAAPTTLAAGGSWTCVYFRTVKEGTTTNTATVDTAQTSSASDVATVNASAQPKPDIALSKTAAPAQLPIGGGNVTYTFLVTNPGNVALTGVSVADDRCVPLTLQGGDTNGNQKLDPGETWKYTCGATLTTTTTNSATATGSFGSTKVSATDKVTVTVLVGEPALHLEKTASPTQLPVGGGTASYSYVVTNIGNAALSNVEVTDDRCSPVNYASGDTNNNDRLDLTETWKFACSTTLTSTTTNHARATATSGDTNVSDTDQATVTVATSAPGIRVVKAANPTSLPAGGGSVTYTYAVTNTGNTPLTSVTLKDDGCASVTLVGGDTNNNDNLDLGETWSYRCVTTITATTTNTATVTGHSGATTVTDTDQATVAVTASNAAINLAKSASVATLPAGGGPVTYTYVVTNKGNVALANVTVIDDKCDAVIPKGGDANGNARLDLGETWTFTCAQTVTTTTTNTALATGFANGHPVTDTDTALVTVGTPTVHTPRIGLTLTANPVVLPDGGGNVTYSYVVANKGDVALTSIAVTDDTCSPIGAPSGDANGNGQLDLTEAWTFICVKKVNATTTSTADASGTADGQTVTAMDMATVTLTPPAPTPTPTDSPTPAPTGAGPGASAGPGSSAGPGASSGPTAAPGGVGASGGLPSPGASGEVQGATSPPRASQAAGTAASQIEITNGHSPSVMVMILVLMLGIVAAVLIMTLSKRTSGV